MFKRNLFVIGVIALFLLSGCQVYEDIYGKSDVSTISMDDIVVEGDDIGEELMEIEEIEDDLEIEEEEGLVEIEEEESKGLLDIFKKPAEEEVDEIVEEEEIIELVDEEIDERAVVIIVQETDLISLEPAANDPDGDPLSYTFTSPLDDSGSWQTTYSDEGEYTITITASDGDLSASQHVLIIVNRKEEAPVIDSVSPEATTLNIAEDNVIEFSVSASDLNDDELYYDWKVDGDQVSTTTSFTYDLDYNSAGSHTVKLSITDSALETAQIWAITVDNVNRQPEMEQIDNVAVLENEPIVVIVEAVDPDGDNLIYSVDSDLFVQEGNVFTWYTTYDDSGAYELTITVTDSDLSTSQLINIDVGNVNRAPVFIGIEQR